MRITTAWMKHPKESLAECVLPFVIILGPVVFLTGLFPWLNGEDPTGPVTWILTESWTELSPLMLFVAALWGYHLISYLLVGSFAKDVWAVATAVRRLFVFIWHRFFGSWIAPALLLHSAPPLSLVRVYRRSLPSWLAVGWRAGESVQLE